MATVTVAVKVVADQREECDVVTAESATNRSSLERVRGSRWIPWIPSLVVAGLTTLVTAVFVITDNSAVITEPQYPSHQLDDAVGLWVQDIVYPIVWLSLLAVIAVHTWRTKKFSVTAILFLAGTTLFWIEWPADWGSYLVYNRDPSCSRDGRRRGIRPTGSQSP